MNPLCVCLDLRVCQCLWLQSVRLLIWSMLCSWGGGLGGEGRGGPGSSLCSAAAVHYFLNFPISWIPAEFCRSLANTPSSKDTINLSNIDY